MQKLLNQKVADSAKPKDKPYQIHDVAVPGLVLRIQPTGTKTWKLIQNRKPRTLGRPPVMTYSMAAEKAMAILRGEDPDATIDTEDTPEVMTLGLFLEKYYWQFLQANHSKPIESRRRLERFGFNDKPLEDIRLADVEAWRTKGQRAGRAPATLNRNTNALKAALQRAVDWDLLSVNPLARLKRLKIDRRPVIRYLLPEEDERLQAALRARDAARREKRNSGNAWRAERNRELMPELGEYTDNLTPLIVLALSTGLRRGELWGLRWGDIDMRRKMLTVHGKGAKSKQTRHIPLNNTALSVLKTHRGAVSPMPNNPVFGQHEFQKAFTAVLKAAKIEAFRFHDTRHTFASRLVMAGVPLNTVRELMGHASLDMTLIYAHLAPDNLRSAVEMLP